MLERLTIGAESIVKLISQKLRGSNSRTCRASEAERCTFEEESPQFVERTVLERAPFFSSWPRPSTALQLTWTGKYAGDLKVLSWRSILISPAPLRLTHEFLAQQFQMNSYLVQALYC